MRPLTIILLVLAISPLLYAQEMRLRRVSMEHGLPQTYVNQIYQDTLGFMWFGTQDGLARYDGRNMKVYRHRQGDSTSLPSNNITDLHISSSGTLCVGTGGGYCTYLSRRDSWRRTSQAAFPRPKYQSRQQIVHDSGINVTYVDRLGRRWVGTVSKGLYVVDPSRKGAVWFSTSEPGERRILSNDIWTLHEDRNGNLWVGTNGGGVAIIRNGQVRTLLSHDHRDPSTLSSNVVRCFYEDNIGSIWIGTYGGGVCQYDPYAHSVALVRPSTLNMNIADDFTRGITQGPGGSIFIGLRTGIIRCNRDLSGGEPVVQWNRDYESTGAARALFVDRLQNLWIGSERRGVGLIRKGSSSIRWLTGPLWSSRPHTSTVSTIISITPDTLAIGTDGGIALVDINTQVPTWFDVPRRKEISEDQIPVSAIVPITDTREYLIGTELGLFRGPLGGPYVYVKCPDKDVSWPSIDIIRSIVVSEGQAFVGTWNGGVRIINLASGRERVIDQRVGLPSDMAYAVVPLSGERIMSSSNAGIVIWNCAQNHLERTIGTSQGAQSLEYNSWSWLRADDGSVYYGGIGGINRVRHDKLQMPPAPSLVINEVRIAGRYGGHRANDDASAIVLDYGASHLSVKVSAIALSSSLPVEYRYRLSGDDDVWIANQTGDLQFPSISPGSYTIVMQSRYDGGEWGKSASINVDVKYPWWQSWWFFVLVAAVLSASVWGIAVLVTKRRESDAYERERLLHEERLRIAKDLHDDVGTGLAKIVILAENSFVDDGASETAKVVADTAREVIDSVRSIVWVMKSTDETLASALGYVREKIADLFGDKKIAFTYEVRVPENLLVDLIVRRNIVLAVKEIATNIVRHSGASNVKMLTMAENDKLVIEIRDDGAGYDTNHNGNGSGIGNIEARMREVGGTMAIESQAGLGTRITLAIPIVGAPSDASS